MPPFAHTLTKKEIFVLFAFIQFIKRLFFVTGYFETGSYAQPLSPQKEAHYLELLAKGDENAREMLICHNMRLVAHVAKKYTVGNDLDDLISIGAIGLIKGVETYCPKRGNSLATYLARCIENEILMSLRSNKRYKNTVYLQEQLGVDGDGNEYTLMDVLPDKEDMFRQVELNVLREKLLGLVDSHLNKREKQIVLLRFGLTGNAPLTQLETANLLGISRSYVSRIETKAIKKLREQMEREF